MRAALAAIASGAAGLFAHRRGYAGRANLMADLANTSLFAAHERNWHTHGVRRAEARAEVEVCPISSGADDRGDRNWDGRFSRPDPGVGGPPLRDQPARSDQIPCSAVGAGNGRSDGELPTGAPSCSCEPRGGFAGGVRPPPGLTKNRNGVSTLRLTTRRLLIH